MEVEDIHIDERLEKTILYKEADKYGLNPEEIESYVVFWAGQIVERAKNPGKARRTARVVSEIDSIALLAVKNEFKEDPDILLKDVKVIYEFFDKLNLKFVEKVYGIFIDKISTEPEIEIKQKHYEIIINFTKMLVDMIDYIISSEIDFTKVMLTELELYNRAEEYGLKKKEVREFSRGYIRKVDEKIMSLAVGDNIDNTHLVNLIDRINDVTYDILSNSDSINYNIKQFAMIKNIKMAYELQEELIKDKKMEKFCKMFIEKLEEGDEDNEADQVKRIEHYRVILEFLAYNAMWVEDLCSDVGLTSDDPKLCELLEHIQKKKD